VKAIDFDVDSLPLDVFELAESGLEVESLTAGHGIPENAASQRMPFPSCCGSGSGCGNIEDDDLF